MSTAIGTVSQLVSVIQSQLTAVANRPRERRQSPVSPGAGRRHTDRGMSALIETRTRNIAPDDPQRGRKAFRIFLEVVLLTQLGKQLMNDPKFYQVIDDVQGALESDPSTAGLVVQATEHLLSKLDIAPKRAADR